MTGQKGCERLQSDRLSWLRKGSGHQATAAQMDLIHGAEGLYAQDNFSPGPVSLPGGCAARIGWPTAGANVVSR